MRQKQTAPRSAGAARGATREYLERAGFITGLGCSKDLLDYSATKGAIHAFTESLAQNLVEKGIAPAYVFFASNGDSSFVTGEVLALLGGETTAE